MIFTKEFLLKGLAGVSLCAGVAGIGVHIYKSSEVKITDPQGQLGLPAECALPDDSTTSKTCNITTENISKINDIKFDGKEANQNPTVSESGSLRITIDKSNDTNFPHGYKFTLTPNGGNLTINRGNEQGGNIVIKDGKSSDFKVKKTDSGFALEEAFTLNTLTNKLADFTCTNGECQIGTTTAISIKQGDHTETKTKLTSQTGSPVGKIKVYSGETDYNKGFKFVIEEGDIALTNVGSGTTISKLEEFETYEIKKEGNDWILVRKFKASEVIRNTLGLAERACSFPDGDSPTNCPIDREKIKTIKFEGMGEEVARLEDNSSNMKLKISKTTDKTAFPLGYKFVAEIDKNIIIPQVSGEELTIKKGTNTEFKIKKTVTNGNIALTLERAWTFDSLKSKVGLTTCQSENGTKKCSFGSPINVYDSATNFVKGASLASASANKKITYEEGVEGYSQGFKFTSTENLTLQGGTGPASGGAILTQISGSSISASYEIKEVGGVWYLAKKA